MNAQRDELAEAIKGYGKSFLGECEEVDVAKIEHSFDCMADGIADYLTEDCGWSKPRTVDSIETWTEWGVERGIWDGWNYADRKVASMRNRAEAERVAKEWATCADNPVAVSRTVSASAWASATPGGKG